MTSGPKRSRSSSKGGSISPTSPPHGEKRHANQMNGVESPPAECYYPLVHQRGQRKYGPPSDWTDDPPRGTEVHVSKLPKDLLEDELVRVFERVGKIYEIRLMMEYPGVNKGFAFVKFCFREPSESAILELNDYEIRPNVRISVRRSIDNNRLFIGNIPKTYLTEDVLQAMKEVSPGVVKVILYASVNDRTKNRGYGFVEFETHQQAKNTRTKLKTNPVVWGGQEVKVDWAEPEPEVDEETMSRVRILYVRNLALYTTDQQLRELFSRFGGVIERVKKIKDYAFIHFATREQAEEAKNNLQGFILDKCEIDISWSKPVTNREEYQQRKAASKALSSAAGIPIPLGQAVVGVNGEPHLINQRPRTAAGAQGYIASRPYPLRPRQNEQEPFTAIGAPFVYPGYSYVPDMIRSPIDPIGLTSTLASGFFAAENGGRVEECGTTGPPNTPTPDIQYHLAQPSVVPRFQPLLTSSPYYNMLNAAHLQPSWGAQSFLPAGNTPTFLSSSPYVIPTPSFSTMPGTYAATPFYGNQLMTQIPSMTGSNMSIDRA